LKARATPPQPHHQWQAAALMTGAALLFALMGALVKLASERYGTGEIVMYRGLVGVLSLAIVVRWQGGTLATQVPGMHFWRSATGVGALTLWFYSIGGLPLATAMTLNYMSSVWMALFLIGGAVLVGATKINGVLVAAVLGGFAGVALVLQPSAEAQSLWHALAGLCSGVLAALAYLQVSALTRAGEPELRVVFYFACAGVVVGGALMLWQGATPHTAVGALQLLGIGLLATLAQLMMTRAYSVGHTLANAVLNYLGIVFAFAIGVLWFGEVLTAGAVVGIVLIVGAGLAATKARATFPSAVQDSKLPGDS
jgi:drug/metabolite transporter (DMT)-like permease